MSLTGENKVIRDIGMFLSLVLILSGLIAFSGCGEASKPSEAEYILKTSVMVITSEEFSEELDLKKTAYPYTIKNQPAEYNEMVVHLVKVLSEEIILLSAARDSGVDVTDSEVDAQEAVLKQDYPDNSFNQMLMENAISYPFWRTRFKKNMIVDKFIDQELTGKIEISSEDIVSFYKKNARPPSALSEKKAGDTDESEKIPIRSFQDEAYLVSSLRIQKTQDSYAKWIEELWEKYPVKINKEKLKTFLIDIESNEEVKDEN